MTSQDSKEVEKHQIIKDDEIDLIALIKTIWDGRKTIYYSVGVCVFIGLLIAFLSPAKYTASAIILPQVENETSFGGLSGLASMAGINMNSLVGNRTGVQPQLYPKVISSYPFLNELVHKPFDYEKEQAPISIYEKQIKDSISGFGENLLKYTIKLPWTIKDLIFNGKKDVFLEIDRRVSIEVKQLSKKEMGVFNAMNEFINVLVDEETGLVTINVEMEEPLLAAQVTQKTVELLQKYITEYKTKQAAKDLDFIKKLYAEKRNEFEIARAALFEYRDRNRNTTEERTNIRYQELRDAYEISSEVYTSLAKQMEQAKIAVKKDTPAFTILEPVKVPIEKSAPRKSSILLISVFMGCFLGTCIILSKIGIRRLKEVW